MAYDLAAIRKAKQTYKAPGVTMGVAAGLTMPTQAPKPVSTIPRTESTLNNIQNSVNKPFEFNAENDQGYQSALRAAQQNLQVSQKNTNAQLRASGQGKSSYSETVANQLANQSNENIANNILPQYVQQAYGRYQDNISNQSNLYGLQYQQDVTTPQNEAALTGNYVPPAAKTAIDGILSLKQQAETKGITAAQRSELSKQADGLRAQLQSLGIDPSKYGANVNASQAGVINPGIRTLAGQSQDQSVKNDNLNAAVTVAGMTGKVVTPQTDYQGLIRQAANPNAPLTAAQGNFDRQQTFNEGQQAFSNQFDQAKFDEDTRRYGLDYALQQQSMAISQQNADTSSFSTNNSVNNANFSKLMDVWQATGQAPSGLESYGVSQGQKYTTAAAAKAEAPKTYEDFQSNIKNIREVDEDGQLTNPQVVQDYIKNSPLSSYEKYRAWVASGFKWPDNVEIPKSGE